MSTLSDPQRAVLRALCDTVVPSIDRVDDAAGFWRRKATDLGTDTALEWLFSTLDEPRRLGIAALLDALGQMGLQSAPSHADRERILAGALQLGSELATGLRSLMSTLCFLYYGLPNPMTGHNPNWTTFGYPGPVAIDRPHDGAPLRPFVVPGDGATLSADVIVVGSGAGGGVVAATLAERGLHVILLEAGGCFTEAEFTMLELWAYQNMYYRGGPTPTVDQNVTFQAGATFGGGTTVNWTNCLRTYPWVRQEWAREFGLQGVDGPEFDQHLDAVLARLQANDRCSTFNAPTLRLKQGAERLEWSFRRVMRNADPNTYSPQTAGYIGFGDATGSKQSTAKTFLRDAAKHGADMLVRTTAQRILVENGRAAGVYAVYSDPSSGARAEFKVRAPRVVVAAGALESPALLLRSRIGGPAVGRYLRLHPCVGVVGYYDEDMKAWWGSPQSGLVDQFANTGRSGSGFLIETTHYVPGLAAAATFFASAADHKQRMFDFARTATFLALVRDHGHGSVTIDAQGQAVHAYDLTDSIDLQTVREGVAATVRLHAAAGATEICAIAQGLPVWRADEALEPFIAKLQAMRFGFGGISLFSAHQMGTCRMGTDPRTSVAGPFGELHDIPGVYIGDGSAFPTAPGTNPMISIMALARRTALAIADAPPR